MEEHGKHLNRSATTCLAAGLVVCVGCNSIINGWLTPIELGSFYRESTLEIRESLSIQDTPATIGGATEPLPEDLVPTAVPYHYRPGDAVSVSIFELYGAGGAQQALIDADGEINLPVVGWLKVDGLTLKEMEERITEALAERELVFDADVLVQPLNRSGNTYTLFGNEALGIRIYRGPGVFPIPRPDFRLIDAVSIAGGLTELVSEVYVFRSISQDRAQAEAIGALPKEQGPSPEPAPSALGRVSAGYSRNRMGRAPLLASVHSAGAQEGGTRKPPPPEEERTKEKEKEGEEPTQDATEAQEIIDLMLPPPTTPPEGEETPQEKPGPSQPTQKPPAEAGPQSPKYIFLNNEWIEVQPEPSPEAALPKVPGAETGPAPAVDWETIAGGEEGHRIIRVSAEDLRRGDSRMNIVIRPSDVIRLYSGDIGFYYMTGHVRGPGTYTFRSGSSVTLKNAVAAAGGLDALAWPDRVTVYRRVADREQMIQVNLDRIYAGVDPDFFLKRDDIVNVGTHPVAPFLLSLRNLTIPQSSGFVSWVYRFARFENEFKNTDLNAQQDFPGLFP